MKVYVFIVTYNRLSLLKKTINSLRKQTHPIDNLCVINNGSTDGTYEWLLEQQDLTVIHQENLGGAGGFLFSFATGVLGWRELSTLRARI